MKLITLVKFENNIDYYLDLSKTEDIYVLKDKDNVFLLTNPKKKATEHFLSLKGCMKEYDTGDDYDDLIGQEVMKRCGY